MTPKARKIAIRYSRALLRTIKLTCRAEGTVQERQIAEILLRTADAFSEYASLWHRSPGLKKALCNPMLLKKAHETLIEESVKVADLSPALLSFIKVLMVNGRISSVPDVAEVFSEMVEREVGVVRVGITTCRALPYEEARSVEDALRKSIKGYHRFEWKEDPAILGGIVINYDGRIVDGSLRARFLSIERQILG